MDVQPMLARAKEISHAIDALYGNQYAEKALEDLSKEYNLDKIVADLNEETDVGIGSAPIVRLVNSLIEQAVKNGASDIHIEPLENEIRMRTRVDGVLSSTLDASIQLLPSIIARIK